MYVAMEVSIKSPEEGQDDPPTSSQPQQSHSSHTITTVMITHHKETVDKLEDLQKLVTTEQNVGFRRDMSFLQVQGFSDVCRICHCGPNTLAAPTPTALTPVTSPKKIVNHPLKHTAPSPHTFPPKPKTSQDYNLISPCICSGSLKYVHQCCLQHWIRASNNTSCELCKHPYELRSTWKPLWKWESLPMSPSEKKRVVCSALFHTVALACVVWSLYVLIDRTIEELSHSDLEWQFWTKIIVEAIGCLGAGILAYVWGKSYVTLLIKWITFNRSFVIMGKDSEQNEHELIQLIQSRC